MYIRSVTFILSIIFICNSCRNKCDIKQSAKCIITNVDSLDSELLNQLTNKLIEEKKSRQEEVVLNQQTYKETISHPVDEENGRRMTMNFEHASGCLSGSDCNEMVKSVYYSMDSIIRVWDKIPESITQGKKKGYRMYFAKYADSEFNPTIAGKNTIILRATLDSIDIPYPENHAYHVAFNFGELCPKNCPQMHQDRFGRYKLEKK